MSQHLVRVGALGRVGRFRAQDATCYPRGADVIVRTRRGLEIGQILVHQDAQDSRADVDGTILRGMTPEDWLLQTRLEKNRHAAFQACLEKLEAHGLCAPLVDVEQLFDGQSLFFYFLGEPDPEVEALVSTLAETYEAKVELAQFAEMLTSGCGPGCGTESAENGCQSTCASCAIAGACGTRKHP